MPEKDPAVWSTGTWLLVIGLSLLGGLTSWYQRVKDGHTRAFNSIELIGEMATSAMMGFVWFAVVDFYLDNHTIAAATAGMSAHFSTRLLFQAEGLLERAAKAAARRIDKLGE